jgi:hypothetical protein
MQKCRVFRLYLVTYTTDVANKVCCVCACLRVQDKKKRKKMSGFGIVRLSLRVARPSKKKRGGLCATAALAAEE